MVDKDLLIAIALGRSTEIIVCPHARRGFRQGPGRDGLRKSGSKWKSDEFSAKTSVGRGGRGSSVKSEKRREMSCEFVADALKTEGREQS